MRYTVKQVAQMWSVCPHTIYGLIDRRELSCVRIGRAVRLRDVDLQEYEEKQWQPANQNIPATLTCGGTRTGGGTSRQPLDVEQLAQQTYRKLKPR